MRTRLWVGFGRRLGLVVGAGYDPVTVPRVGRQDAVIPDQVEPWWGYEGSQFLEQLEGGQHQMGSAVGPGRLEREGELPVVVEAQSPRRQSRTRNIAAQLLEAQPVLSCDAGGCVQGETARGKAQRRRCERLWPGPAAPVSVAVRRAHRWR